MDTVIQRAAVVTSGLAAVILLRASVAKCPIGDGIRQERSSPATLSGAKLTSLSRWRPFQRIQRESAGELEVRTIGKSARSVSHG